MTTPARVPSNSSEDQFNHFRESLMVEIHLLWNISKQVPAETLSSRTRDELGLFLYYAAKLTYRFDGVDFAATYARGMRVRDRLQSELRTFFHVQLGELRSRLLYVQNNFEGLYEIWNGQLDLTSIATYLDGAISSHGFHVMNVQYLRMVTALSLLDEKIKTEKEGTISFLRAVTGLPEEANRFRSSILAITDM